MSEKVLGFKQWLEKSHKVDWHSDLNEFRNCVSVEALGNWAWQSWICSLEEWLESVEIQELSFYFKDYAEMPEMCFNELDEVLGNEFEVESNVREWMSYQIAFACLGNQEIEKRLKELAEKEAKKK